MSNKTFKPYHQLDEEFRKSLTNIIWYNTKQECIANNMNNIKIKTNVKELEVGLLTKIDFNNRLIEIYEVYIGYFIEAISDLLITIYDIETDTNINVFINEDSNIYQYKQPNPLADYYKQIEFKEGNRN